MKAYQAKYTVAMLCRVLEVSASGYYAWCKRPPSARRQADVVLGDRIESIFRTSRRTYGRPRIHADLRDEGINVSGKRIARLMRERGVKGASRRKGIITTLRDLMLGRHPISSTASSAPMVRMRFGSPTSRTFRRGQAFCTWPSFSMSTAGASSVGQWQIICALNSFSKPSTWRSSADDPGT